MCARSEMHLIVTGNSDSMSVCAWVPPVLLHYSFTQANQYKHMQWVYCICTTTGVFVPFFFSFSLSHTICVNCCAIAAIVLREKKTFIQTIHDQRFSAGPVDTTHIETMEHTNIYRHTGKEAHTNRTTEWRDRKECEESMRETYQINGSQFCGGDFLSSLELNVCLSACMCVFIFIMWAMAIKYL